MNKEKINAFTLITTLLCIIPSIVFADMVWPSLYIAEGARCWYIILGGFIIETLFIKFYIDKTKWTKAILVSFVMNLVSTLCGIILIPISGIIGEIILLPVPTFSIWQWIMDIIMAAIANVLIEGLVIKIIFKIDFKKNFWFLFMANLVSVGYAMIPILTGKILTDF